MERSSSTLGRIVAVVAGVALAIWVLVGADASTAGVLGAAAIVLVTGVVANRAWTALLPVVAFVAWLVLTLASNPPDNQEFGWEFVALLFGVAAGAACLLVLAGVGLRRAARAVSRPRTTPRDSR